MDKNPITIISEQLNNIEYLKENYDIIYANPLSMYDGDNNMITFKEISNNDIYYADNVNSFRTSRFAIFIYNRYDEDKDSNELNTFKTMNIMKEKFSENISFIRSSGEERIGSFMTRQLVVELLF